MGLQKTIAQAASSAISWGLKNVARSGGGNLPGKVALAIDPKIVAEMRSKISCGSVVVVGTNGKTTVTNLVADTFEKDGRSVLCNRAGSNLKSGIATALLQSKRKEWAVIECDELWFAKVAPDLQPTYLLLLNLFRDQLDRCGEIELIQDSILSALAASPGTTVVYNADDPLCAYVASICKNKTVAFGVGQNLNLEQNRVSDATMCQVCSHLFDYEYRQYGQLGAYKCPECGFERPKLDYIASGVEVNNTVPQEGQLTKLSFDVKDADNGSHLRITTSLVGTYMVYNLLAVASVSLETGVKPVSIQSAIDAFNPKNGRQQKYDIDGHPVLLNLAKNPTGFNQNLRLIEADKRPGAAAFFINDQVVDGRDISWIWDIDFEELANKDVVVFAGGSRANDLQVRLKYAGISATIVADISEAISQLSEPGMPLFAIANYSALPAVKKQLDTMSKRDAPNRHHRCRLERSAQRVVERSCCYSNNPSYPRSSDCDLHKDAPYVISTEVSASERSGEISRMGNIQQMSNEHQVIHPGDFSTPALRTSARNDMHMSKRGAPNCISPIVIAHVLPELLNLYGDGGNIAILEQRLKWRGIPVEVRRYNYGDILNLDDVDLVFLGGGPDREQKLATEALASARDDIAAYIADGGALLAICGGYQILGRTWLYGDEEVPGLNILGLETRRPGPASNRLISNVALESPVATHPVVGFENHAGRTYLDADASPFGNVVSKTGRGNNDSPALEPADGVLQDRVLGTYLHGVLLSKNPEVADYILKQAIARHSERTGENPIALAPLDDSEELAANKFMTDKILTR